MNRTRRILILAACLLLALMAVVPTALAAPGDLLKPDVGNFNDYDGGGSSGGGSDPLAHDERAPGARASHPRQSPG